jgi:S-disulfanyl-L-cysteine oxidoreductase SoxD
VITSRTSHTRVAPSYVLAAVALGALLGALIAPLDAGEAVQTSPRTVWDRVYSDEQAKRGESLYLDECGRCHAETLSGGDFGPPVVGASFWEQWDGKPLTEVFARIRETMPQDNPGRLDASQSADVLAFLMKANGFPSGPAPLGSESASLNTITVTSTQR